MYKNLTLILVVLICGCTPLKQQNFRPTASNYVPLDKIEIKPKYDTILLTKENYADELRKCTFSAEMLSEYTGANKRLADPKVTAVSRHYTSANIFVSRGATGLCIEFSANNHPIFAAETFTRTANPTGVPANIMLDWHTKIAYQIALTGRAKVAYITSRGTAWIVEYRADNSMGLPLRYSSDFMQAGQWENIAVDFQFSHPRLDGFVETVIGKSKAKTFPLADDR